MDEDEVLVNAYLRSNNLFLNESIFNEVPVCLCH